MLEDDSIQFKIDAVNESWEEKVEFRVQQEMRSRAKQIRADAIAKSRAGQLGKTLEKLAPMFPGFGHHPYDVRPIFDPIDFVIFDGYFTGNVTDIVFVEFKTGNSRLKPHQKSIRTAIEKKRVFFEERRLSKQALDMLAAGRTLTKRPLIE